MVNICEVRFHITVKNKSLKNNYIIKVFNEISGMFQLNQWSETNSII